jgi:predicted metalloprotease
MRFRKGAKLDPSQVEDYRGQGGGRGGLGGLGGGKMLGGGGGIVGIVVLLLVVFVMSQGGGGLGQLGSLAGQTVGPGATPNPELANECRTGQDANEREDCRIVAVVNSVQAYWRKTLRNYEPARTRFFDGQISTGCGVASPAIGPFYCPGDSNIYIDLGFFDQMQSQLGAEGGPLAEAYILAHEYGHHVQNLTGVLRGASRDTGPQGGQVRVELQADCYAGLWVGSAIDTGLVEDITRADIADALDAASAVGDDRIQERAQGRVTPESWTHGSSEQRRSWFVRGLDGSGPDSCDTFKGQV